ncbi:MAG: HAD hydrolase family protein [Acholeplasmatales bacterium]|jgi:hydroxymethylpyrimidine pyrophosphatase-like HAD family hydrolase|nr:HAD hydrolase family protein [Acholeplasmatales bacterium]
MFPRIGLRIIKSSIAVLICLTIDIILRLIDPEFSSIIFNPFFAGLGAVYSITSSKENTRKLAKIRTVGSLLGAIWGIIVVYLGLLFGYLLHLDEHTIVYDIFKYLLVSLSIIVIIYSTILLKQTSATFVTLLTFLSVSVGNRTELIPALFAFNRAFSTIFGVFIALIVNVFTFHILTNKNLIFLFSIDGGLIEGQRELTIYQKFNLNYLIERKAKIYIISTRGPASLKIILEDIDLNTPLVCMNGNATYDVSNDIFSNVINLKQESRFILSDYFKKKNYNVFYHVISDGTLQIYYSSLNNEADTEFFKRRTNKNYRNCARAEVPIDLEINYLIINVLKKDCVSVLNDLYSLELEDVNIFVFNSKFIPGYTTIKIGSNLSNKYSSFMKIYQPKENEKIISFVSSSSDYEIIKNSYLSFSLESSNEDVKDLVDYVIPSSNQDDVVKFSKKLYFHKNKIDKYKKHD